MSKILQRGAPVQRQYEPIQQFDQNVVHGDQQKQKVQQKTKAQLIEEQLSKMPQFDIEVKRDAPQLVSKTGLKAKQLGRIDGESIQIMKQIIGQQQEVVEKARPASEAGVRRFKSGIPAPSTNRPVVKPPVVKRSLPQPIEEADEPERISHKEPLRNTQEPVLKNSCAQCGAQLPPLMQHEAQTDRLCELCIAHKYREVQERQMRLLAKKAEVQQPQPDTLQFKATTVPNQAVNEAKGNPSVFQTNEAVTKQSVQNQQFSNQIQETAYINERFSHYNIQKESEIDEIKKQLEQLQRQIKNAPHQQQHLHEIDPESNDIMRTMRKMNAKILSNFPFIVERRVCPDCGDVLGFRVVDQFGAQVGADKLKESIISQSQEEDNVVHKQKQNLNEEAQKQKRDRVEQLMQLDEKLGKLQIAPQESIRMGSILIGVDSSQPINESTGELNFGVQRQFQ